MSEDQAIAWLSDPFGNATMRYDAEVSLRHEHSWPEKFILMMRTGRLRAGTARGHSV